MIFIITPHLSDFKSVCAVKKIPCNYNFNGMPANQSVRWIDNIEKLYGMKIGDKDEVIYGFRFGEFSIKDQKNIQMEIRLRQKIC